MDIDEMSISSDFSIIPDSMVNAAEENNVQRPISMNASFLRSEERSLSSSTVSVNPKASFNKVQFGTLQRTYDSASGEGALFAVFSCDSDLIMTKLDRIAMYKVGFSSSKNYISFVWVPVANSSVDSMVEQASLVSHHVPITVKFEESSLPEESEEFYQICYLLHDGQIAGVSVPFQLKPFHPIKYSQEDELENAARKVLSIRVEKLVSEQVELRESIQDLEVVCNDLKDDNDKLCKKSEETRENLQYFQSRSDEFEEQVGLLEGEIEQMKLELIEKDDQIQKNNCTIEELQSKLTSVVLELNSKGEIIDELKEDKAVTEERQKLIMKDSVDLKTCLQWVKEDLDTALKAKEAAEKIAVDLRQRLNKASEEYQGLAKVNNKLLRKVKKIKREMDIMEAVNSEGYLCVQDAQPQYEDNEEGTVDLNEMEELETYPKFSREGSQAREMRASASPSVMTSSCVSNCTQNTKELTEAFSQKMEDIVSQLSQQKEQIKSLKNEIEKSRNQSQNAGIVTHISNTGAEISQSDSNLTQISNAEVETNESSIFENLECSFQGAQQLGECDASLSDTQKEAKINNLGYQLNAPDDDKKVLYGHTFLPTSCTAPVFFPPPVTEQPNRTILPSAPSPSHSLVISEVCSIMAATDFQNSISVQTADLSANVNSSSPAQDSHSKPLSEHQSVGTATDNLPPPLQPETTISARNAAVLKQFINESTMTNSVQNLPESEIQQHPVEAENVEDHFQDACEHPGRDSVSRQDESPMTMLGCPMCHLAFERSGIHMLQEHINSHLEKVCPMCSTAFPRNTKQEEFEVHVHSHFPDEANHGSDDSSGPWGEQQDSPHQSFHLLEID